MLVFTDREVERCDLLTVFFFQIFYDLTIGGVIHVHVGNIDKTGQFIFFAELPCLLGADFNAGFAVNYDDGSACSLYRFFYFAYKVKISGSIQNIYLHAVPFDGNNGGINRNLSLLFFLAIITDGIAVCDLTHSGCNASQISHCLSQTGFARTAMA